MATDTRRRHILVGIDIIDMTVIALKPYRFMHLHADNFLSADRSHADKTTQYTSQNGSVTTLFNNLLICHLLVSAFWC